jgi:hypothetical protein
MNYLTNYYKNLCEQLEQRVNQLSKQLQEANVRSPEDSAELAGREYSKKHNAFRLANQGRYPEMGELDAMMRGRHRSSEAFRRNMVRNATAMLGDIAQAGDQETVRQIGQVLHGMTDVRDPSLKIAGAENVGPTIPVAAYRKMIQIAKGKYQVPWQDQPSDLDPDRYDSPMDTDTQGSSEEVAAAQQRNQYQGRLDAVRQQPELRRLSPEPTQYPGRRF